MKFIKKTQEKIANMSVPCAILTSGLTVGLSVFLTTWVFFGGDNNRQKFSVKNPALNRTTQQANQLTAQQIQQQQQMQQQRQALLDQQANTAPKPAVVSTTTAPKAPVKK